MLATNSNAQSYRVQDEAREQIHTGRLATRSRAERLNRASMVICLVAAICAIWIVCDEGAQIYSMSYGNVKMQSQIQTIAANNASLTAQVDELERPSRILDIAINKHHMQYANPVRIGGSAVGK